MTKQLFRYVKKFLPIIGILLLAYLVYIIGPEDILNSVFQIHPIYIVIALFLMIPRVFVRNYAWQLIQKEQKIKIGYWQSLKIMLIGFFYGSWTPGYVGQLMRIPYMKQKTSEPYGKLFINVIIEVTLHSLSLYLIIVIGALLILSYQPAILYIIIAYLVITGVILFYFIKKERGEKLLCTLIKWFIPKSFKGSFNSFVSTFYTDFPKIRRLVLPFIISSISWILIFTQEYIIIIALDLDIPYLYFLLLFPIANAAGFIPATFGGLGFREYVAVLIFSTIFLVPDEKILVVSILGFLITDVFTGFIGFLLSLTETRDKSYKNLKNN